MLSEYLEIQKASGIDTVVNKKDQEPLGEFFWNKKWRRFVFEPMFDTYFSYDCLEFISYHLKKKNTKKGED